MTLSRKLMSILMTTSVFIGCGGLNTSSKTDCSGPQDCIDGYTCKNDVCVSEDDRSPIDGSKDVRSLTEDEVKQFCTWYMDIKGGEGREAECGEGQRVRNASIAECAGELLARFKCDITIDKLEECLLAQGDDLCETQKIYDTHPDCAEIHRCFFTVKGTVKIADTFDCGATEADDCKGTLVVAINNGSQKTATALRRYFLTSIDLSDKSVQEFELESVPVDYQKVYLVAALLETTRSLKDPLGDTLSLGDIVGVLEEVTPKPKSTVTLDVTLDERYDGD